MRCPYCGLRPAVSQDEWYHDHVEQCRIVHRSKFAGMAMQGILADAWLLEQIGKVNVVGVRTSEEKVGKLACDQADALLAELAKE